MSTDIRESFAFGEIIRGEEVIINHTQKCVSILKYTPLKLKLSEITNKSEIDWNALANRIKGYTVDILPGVGVRDVDDIKCMRWFLDIGCTISTKYNVEISDLAKEAFANNPSVQF